MDSERKEFGLWWVWVLLLLIISGIIITAIGYGGRVADVIVEREIFEHSYQKRAADEDALSAYDAQLSVLERRLRSQNLTEQERSEIQGQIDAITILKRSKGN